MIIIYFVAEQTLERSGSFGWKEWSRDSYRSFARSTLDVFSCQTIVSAGNESD